MQEASAALRHLKLALTADGFIARSDGTSKWITGEEARAHAHLERAMSDAILVGGATLRADDPRLDVRLPGLETRGPRRFVLTREARPLAGKPLPTRVTCPTSNISWSKAARRPARRSSQPAWSTGCWSTARPVTFGEGFRGLSGRHSRRLANADRRQLGKDCLEVYLPA